MTTENGRPDWRAHALKFRELKASQGMKIKEYAALHGLKENTARRAITEVIKQLGDQDGDQKSDQNAPEKKEAKKPARGRKPKSDEPTETRTNTGKGDTKKGKKGAVTRSRQGDADNQKVGDAPPKNVVKLTVVDHPQNNRVVTGEVVTNKRGAPKGSQNRLTTGKHAQPIREDVAAAMADMDAFALDENWHETLKGKLLVDVLSHKHLLERAREKSLRRLLAREIDEADAPPPKQDGDGMQFQPTPAEFQQLKMLTESGYAITDQIRTAAQLLQTIDKAVREREQHAMKQEAHAQAIRHKEEAHVVRMYGKKGGEDIREAFVILDQKDGGAIKAAQHLEIKGIKVPEVIARLVELEIRAQADAIDETVGMTNEELDAFVAAAEAKRAGQHQWLAQRREEVQAITDTGGYGDFDEDGTRRSDEGQAPFVAGEEEDLSATADLYNDELTASPLMESTSTIDEEILPIDKEDPALWEGADRFVDDEPGESISNHNGEES